MNKETVLRRALWVAVAFNVGGALLFGLPQTGLGPVTGMPTEVPALYRAFAALFILLFAGAYAYLARHPVINRPFVAFAAIGKASAFLVALLLWTQQALSTVGLVLFSGDLILAGVFGWALTGSSRYSAGSFQKPSVDFSSRKF